MGVLAHESVANTELQDRGLWNESIQSVKSISEKQKGLWHDGPNKLGFVP